jgi:hypothetical protein
MASWAHSQVSNARIVSHTQHEEKGSDFHSAWTKSITESVLRELDKKSGVLINAYDERVKEHIVRTCLRGHVYGACGLRDTYLPHYIREGLLSFSCDPNSMIRAIYQSAGIKVNAAQSGSPESDVPLEVKPLFVKSVFESFGRENRWSAVKLANDLRAERATEQNKLLRQHLREAGSDAKRAEILRGWTERLKRDKDISRGEVLPVWLDLIPRALSTVKVVDAVQVEALLLKAYTLAPKTIVTMANNPIYFCTHMRYLWKCANGRCSYVTRAQVAQGPKQKLLSAGPKTQRE